MEKDARMRRRMVGMLVSRLPEAQFEAVEDPRGDRGKRWQLAALLRAVVVGAVTGCKSLAQTEGADGGEVACSPAPARFGAACRTRRCEMRRSRVEPKKLRQSLHAQTKAAHRRKALEPDGMPFGVAAMDGKGSTATAWDRKYAQKQTHSAGLGAVGLVRNGDVLPGEQQGEGVHRRHPDSCPDQ